MKYFSFLFLLGITLHAQLPQTVIDNTWYLRAYDDGTENGFFNFADNPEFDEITLDFYMENNVLHFRTQVCSVKSGIVIPFGEENEQMIDFIENQIEGEPCVELSTKSFESAYFSHIYEEEGYWYDITENEDGSLEFSLSSPSFCYAVFSNQLLSTQENRQSEISLYPNPVHDKLIIENLDSQIKQIKITDANGKLIYSQKVNSTQNEIEFSQYPKGIYLITTESNGKVKTEKIIKK
jgi:hypothetical protein